jgi:hypothetical protein
MQLPPMSTVSANGLGDAQPSGSGYARWSAESVDCCNVRYAALEVIDRMSVQNSS